MGYAWETYYYFQSHSGTSGLFLNREGSGTIQNNQNVSIYKGNSDGRTAAGCTIRSKLDPQ